MKQICQIEDGKFVDYRWVDGTWNFAEFSDGKGGTDWDAVCLTQSLFLLWPLLNFYELSVEVSSENKRVCSLHVQCSAVATTAYTGFDRRGV